MNARRPGLALTVSAFFSCATIAADAPSTNSQWMREDIVAFREKFLTVDNSFTRETRAAAEARLEQLSRRVASVQPAEFVIELCRIVALADNGHTRCMSESTGREVCRQWGVIVGREPPDCQGTHADVSIPNFATVAIDFEPFRSDFHVVGVDKESADLLGARVSSVNGRSVASIRDVLRSFSGGKPAFRDVKAAGVLASPERLHAVGLGDHARSVTYELVTLAGQEVERTFELGAKSSSMVHLPASTASTPWALQEMNDPFRFRDAPELNAVIVQLRHNVDAPNEKIDTFLKEAEASRAKLDRKNVVLDMRFNGGGNLMLTRDFMAAWPSLVPGRFYVLTSVGTFSAGIASLAYLKQAGGDRVVIIGEPVGDRLMFFSDGKPVRLPHTGQFILPALVRMDFHDGCRKYDDCFAGISQPGRPTAPLPPGMTSIERKPLSVASLDPDVVAPWTIEAWINGSDPMLDAVESLIGKAR